MCYMQSYLYSVFLRGYSPRRSTKYSDAWVIEEMSHYIFTKDMVAFLDKYSIRYRQMT